MPGWNVKDDRQYQHIKQSERARGRTIDRAEAIAARTVNKQRRGEGRTPSTRTGGTGNPSTRLELRSIDELRNRAGQLSILRARRLPRGELIAAIRRRNGNRSA
jgi:hypothetical protein